ncbi:MAG: DUF4129 domain-containing protein [Candidatus Dormibacteria bacterium]
MDDQGAHEQVPSASRGPGAAVPRWFIVGMAVVVLLTLLAIVAVATQAHYAQQLIPTPAHGALGGAGGAAAGQLGVTILLAAGELGIVAVLVFFPYRRLAHLGDPGPPVAQLGRGAKLRLMGLSFGLVAALLLVVLLGLKRRRAPFHTHLAAGGGRLPASLTRPTGSVNMGGDLLVASVVVLLLVLAVGATVYLRSRRRRDWRAAALLEPSQPELPEELAGALDGGLDELSSGADPRLAVILAYSRMERALGERGLIRHHFETHLEYLERAMTGLRASASALARLTALFETARFSPHPVDGGMRQEAEAALTRLRDELRTPS